MKELTNLCLRAVALLVAATAAVSAQDVAPTVSLFDGKTLDGWEYDPAIWRIEDGVINPLFPALRSAPTAVSGASRPKQILRIQLKTHEILGKETIKPPVEHKYFPRSS